MAETEAVELQPEPDASAYETAPSVLGFDGTMVLLTWTAFAIAAAVLGKFLWKPILGFVEARENEIRDSLDDAAKARKSAAEADAKSAALLADAKRTARTFADERAAETQRHIAQMENEAREAIAARKKAADEQLAAERVEALARLRDQAGEGIAAALERLLPDMLTEEQRQAYQDRIAAEVRLDGTPTP